ncbi:MAG: AAA family ATPase [Symploca sp. SIO2E6]|nr:AAA family ATPase [Symploca sp. SIO2E6]
MGFPPLSVKQLSIEEYQASSEKVVDVAQDMVEQKELIVDASEVGMLLCYKPSFYYTEMNLAQRLSQYLSKPVAADLPRVKNWIERFTESRDIALSQQQQQAVEMAAYSRIMVLTGGPGCGKTFTTHTIVSLWKAMGKSIALAAPTGRAAQRLAEMTGLALQ